ncbi:MAG: carboxylate-amine ligase [Lysobacteraceae bacterium]
MVHPYTFGIEEEFFLTNPRTRDIVADPPQALFDACRAAFGGVAAHELLRSQIELSSPVFAHTAEAIAWLRESRARLGALVAEFGLRVLSAGTHPMAQWREQRATDLPRYVRLFDDFQIVAQRNLLCGLHVHVAVPPGQDRIHAMNRTLPWLPMLLALSASSPFWARQRTGLMSYRQAVYDEWPRTGIPDRFADERRYEDFVSFMVRSGSMPDASQLWWAIRPSLRYPTLELRIADACPLAADALCIAALFRAIVCTVCEDPRPGDEGDDLARLLIEENRWRAKRSGTEASFLSPPHPREVSLAEWLDLAEARFGPAAEAAGDGWAFARARASVAEGGSAGRQLAIYTALRDAGAGRDPALRPVVDALLHETLSDTGFPTLPA